MQILMINKFLYPNGGSETYIFKLGNYLKNLGHEVQYFGMEHEGRCVGNAMNAYTRDMDFHGGSRRSKLIYPFRTIYSMEARKKLRLVLDDLRPEVCHINNFNYQLTPSIILEIMKWRKENHRKCRIVFTAHDYQLVCPNHMLNNPVTHKNCEKCLGGHFLNCIKGKCIHGSRTKSIVGTAEAIFWKWNGAYKYIDTIICCSEFLKTKMDTNPLFRAKTVALHNFVDRIKWKDFNSEQGGVAKKDYVLYFGRYTEEKGVRTFLKAAVELPEIRFVCAGKGPLEGELFKSEILNVINVGFKSGTDLTKLIAFAQFSVVPSEWYEPFGLSIIESQQVGTPVIGSDTGSIPALIESEKTGELFERGNVDELRCRIQKLWSNRELAAVYSQNCKDLCFDDVEAYVEKLMKIYKGREKA